MGRMLTTTRHNLILRSRASSTLFLGSFELSSDTDAFFYYNQKHWNQHERAQPTDRT